jgi:hypothetical protein
MAIMIICAIITHSNVYVPREQYEKTIFAIKLCGGEAHSIIINLALPKRFLFIFLSLLFVCALRACATPLHGRCCLQSDAKSCNRFVRLKSFLMLRIKVLN